MITTGIKKYKSVIKIKKKHDKIVLLGKAKLNTIKTLIPKSFDSFVSHDEFVSVNDLLREYEMKEETKNVVEHTK